MTNSADDSMGCLYAPSSHSSRDYVCIWLFCSVLPECAGGSCPSGTIVSLWVPRDSLLASGRPSFERVVKLYSTTAEGNDQAVGLAGFHHLVVSC